MNQADLSWRERGSESAFVESVWTSNAFVSTTRWVIADPCISLALVKNGNHAEVFVGGPKTEPALQVLPAGHTCTTIRLKPGVFLNNFQALEFINRSIIIPADTEAGFQFGNTRFQFPDFNHAERLIEELYAAGYLGFELPQSTYGRSRRTYSRQTRRITGLSPYKLYQLQRMHQALRLLKQGATATEVATELAFTDQAHFIHASRRFFGHTPRQLSRLPQNP